MPTDPPTPKHVSIWPANCRLGAIVPKVAASPPVTPIWNKRRNLERVARRRSQNQLTIPKIFPNLAVFWELRPARAPTQHKEEVRASICVIPSHCGPNMYQ